VACFAEDATLATDVGNGLLTNRLVAGVKITSGKQVLAEVKKAAEAGEMPLTIMSCSGEYPRLLVLMNLLV